MKNHQHKKSKSPARLAGFRSVFLMLTMLLLVSWNANATRRYVDSATSAGSPTGLSWATAYPKFETAVTAAASGDTIWVAKGTYQPSASTSYTLKNGVVIYGGFTNTATLLSQRDWVANKTRLKGNNNTVMINTGINATAVLDGFTIMEGGKSSQLNFGGGGMANSNSSPTLRNLIITNNFIRGTGFLQAAGMQNSNSSPTLFNVVFSENIINSSAGQANGGGMVNQSGSNPVLTNVIFSANRCESGSGGSCYSQGAGMYNNGSAPVLNNVVFSKNVCYTTSTAGANTFGGGIYSRDNTAATPITLTNVVFIGDSAIYGGAMFTTNNYAVITNCTYASNKGFYQGFYAQTSSVNITNTLFYNHQFGDLLIGGTPKATITNYCYANSTFAGTGNVYSIGANPFYDINNPEGPDGIWMTADDGLRLYYNAPAAPIDLGQTISTPAFSAAIATAAASDIKGTPRPVGGTYDIGAYEGGVKGATIYVDSANVTGTHDGFSWTTAFNKLEDALDTTISNSGSPIWVAKGTYQPPAGQSFKMNVFNKIYGGFVNTDTNIVRRNWTANKTILKGNGNRVINNDYVGSGKTINSFTVLDGFTVTGGTATGSGGGIYNNGAWPTLRNIIFTGNTATGHGGGICYDFVNGSTSTAVTLNNVSFINNKATLDGGGMSIRQTAMFIMDNVYFSNDTANGNGGAIANHGAAYRITNAVFENNRASYGGACYNTILISLGTTITNTVFNNNKATVGAAAIYNNQAANALLTNVTFYNNTSPLNRLFVNIDHVQQKSWTKGINCVFWGNSALAGNAGGDTLSYSLTQATIPGTQNEVATVSPFVNDAVPVGADGIWKTADDGLALAYGVLPSAINTGKTIVAADGNTIIPDVVTKDITGYARPSGFAYDKGAYEYRYTTPVSRFYVDSTHIGGLQDGITWATAYSKLENALTDGNLGDGDTVWVAKGTYQPVAATAFKMVKGVAIYGGFLNTHTSLAQRNPDVNKTILKGNGAKVIDNTFTAASPMTNTAILDGFIIRDGYAGDGFGGGIYNYYASPILRNLIITKNVAVFGLGGGIYLDNSSPILTNVKIDSNNADGGGGIFITSGTPILTNLIISRNNATYYGGGIYSEISNAKMTNVVFDRNVVTDEFGQGGGYSSYSDASPELNNVIFYGNTAEYGAGLYSYSTRLRIKNATFSRNAAANEGGGFYSSSIAALTPLITNSIFWGNTHTVGTKPDIVADFVKPNYNFTQSDFSGGNVGNIIGTASPFVNDAAPAGPDSTWFTADDGLQLKYCTPALNAGINDSVLLIPTDILNHLRIKNAIVDMGAYEKQSVTDNTQFASNVALSSSSANALPFPSICDDNNGWTYYADPTDPDSLGFAINWGSGNSAAKAAAIISIKTDAVNTNVATATAGIFAMRRYWNVDLNSATLVNPVQVRFYYDPTDTIALHSAVTTAGFGTGKIMWFKTTGAAYSPSQVTATDINGGNKITLAPVYGADNGVAYVQFSNIASFSGGTAGLVGSATPLPVKLLEFTAVKNADNKSVLTRWQVAEEDLDHYEVERSADAVRFEIAGKVTATGKSSYSFNDVLSGLQYPVLYYRLRMVDKGGSYSYSKTEKVSFEGKDGITTVSPNPAKTEVVVRNTNAALNGRTAMITDATGRLVQQFTITTELNLNISNYQPGIYFIKIPDGAVLKMIKE